MKKIITCLLASASIFYASAEALTAASFGVPTGSGGTIYGTFTTGALESGAVYNGNMCSNPTNANTIQLRWKDGAPTLSAGIVSTTSGGSVTSVSVKWHTATSDARTLTVYGSNTPYSSWEDLTTESTGIKLGEMSMAEAKTQNYITTLPLTEDFKYIGIRSSSGAIYLEEIDIDWDKGGTELKDPMATFGVEEFEVRLGETAEYPVFTSLSGATPQYSSSDSEVATIDVTGNITPIKVGTSTISATVEATGEYRMGIAKYVLNVRPANTEITPGDTDYITSSTFGIPTGVDGQAYGVFRSQALSSGAEYEICASNNPTNANTLQLRWKEGSPSLSAGLVSLISKGKVKTVSVRWNPATSSTRVISIYGKNEPYSSWEDLTDTSKKGVLIATLAIADASENISVAEISGDYEYIGLNSTGGAVYLDEIDVTWRHNEVALKNPEVSFGVSEVTVKLGEPMDFPGLTTLSDSEPVYTSSNEEVAEIDSTTGSINVLTAGTSTITATLSSTDEYQAGSASYTLIVLPADIVIEPGDTDYITAATFGIPTGVDGQAYGVFRSQALSSGAEYEVSASNNPAKINTLQMRWKEGSPNLSAGLISLSSGGYLKTVTVKWNSETLENRSVAIYGKNEPYSGWEDLTDNTKCGELIATLAIAEATDYVSVAEVTGDYKYMGLHSTSGAVYLEEIDVQWQQKTVGTEEVHTEQCQEILYYDLYGRLTENQSPGLYLKKTGNKVEKIIIR